MLNMCMSCFFRFVLRVLFNNNNKNKIKNEKRHEIQYKGRKKNNQKLLGN